MSHRRGLTLLEIVLALAILAGALVILGELVRIGAKSASIARGVTQAQLLCQSKLAELTSGMVEPQVAAAAIFPEDPNWLYSVNLERIDEQGLLAVQVTVRENVPAGRRGQSFSLVRWMPDPGMELPEDAALNPTAADTGGAASSTEGSP
ncbi:MAG: prepilin-type N-terminal cleavage/methylation domain-containing protein [Pirellulales bacterium]